MEYRAVMLAFVENARRKQLAWVEFILRSKGWKRSRLAKEAGVDHSTITKWFNDPVNVAQLNTMTVEKIAQASGVPPYETSERNIPRGVLEDEASPYQMGPGDTLRDAVAALKAGKNGVDPWVLRSRALENAGYLPGDILMVDLNAEPRAGDAVCAQVYDRHGRAETVMRLYEDPFLTGATLDRQLMRPMLVDGDRVLVRGVVVASLRPRRAA